MEHERSVARTSRRLFGLGLAGAVVGSALVTREAQAGTAGVLFAKHQIGGGTVNEFTWYAKPDGWLYMPGGFMVLCDGGHILRVKKQQHNNHEAWKITFDRKFDDGTIATHQNGLLYASYNHITYTVNGSRRRLVFNKEVMLHWRKNNQTLMHRIWIKQGSVVAKS